MLRLLTLVLVCHAALVFGQSSGSFNSAPTVSYTFDSAPVTLPAGNNFTWLSEANGRNGIASLDGRLQVINLLTLPSNTGQVFPSRIGGSLSFEFWVFIREYQYYARFIEIGNGMDNVSVVVGTVSTINSLYVRVESSQEIDYAWQMPNSLLLGTWMHVVCSFAQRSPQITDPESNADLACFVQGKQVGGVTAVPLPPLVSRSLAWLGKSNSGPDALLNGMIDAFYCYNYALSAEQAAVHYLLPRPPVFDLSFAVDPRPFVGLTPAQAGYQWTTADSSDFNGTSVNLGIIVLNGNNQFIDVSRSTGTPNSVGTALPIIGGIPAVIPRLNSGLSFELLFRTPDQQVFAKLMDFGRGAAMDNIVFGFQGESLNMTFEVFLNGVNDGYMTIIRNATLGQWYHVVLVILPGATETTATHIGYVQGIEVARSTNNRHYPARVNRNSSFIGKSNWAADQTFNGSIDAVRVYDYALDPLLVSQLYTLVQLPGLYTTGPKLTYTFDFQPTQFTGGTNYTWLMNQNGRTGIASFDGITQQMNLLSTRDNYGNLFPRTFGGAFSFEFWARWRSYNPWRRLIDIGFFNTENSIGITNLEAAENFGGLRFWSFEPSRANSDLGILSGAWVLNQWTHIICSVRPQYPGTTSVSAIWACYVNGAQSGAIIGVLPTTYARTSALIAASNWPTEANQKWNGSLDAFYFYDYGMTEEQAKVHYIVPRPPVFELAFQEDPRIPLGMNEQRAGYGWVLQDTTDFNQTATNNGILTLNGVDQYVNLGVSSGPHSVGTTAPIIGGPSSATTANQRGWTIEVLFRSPDQQYYGRVYDIGVGENNNNIMLYFLGQSTDIVFSVLLENFASPITVLPAAQLGVWYHIVVTMQVGSSENNSIRRAFVNGVETANGTGNYPRGIPRPNAFLGRSNWDRTYADEKFNGSYDSFRLYDYVLSPDVIGRLYTAVRRPDLYQTAPSYEFTFDTAPTTQQLSGGSQFTWLPSSGVGHNGVASFNGVNQYVNLMTFTDRRGNYFSDRIGGPMSFEFWLKWNSYDEWRRVVDIGTVETTTSIAISNVQKSPDDPNANLGGIRWWSYQPSTAGSELFLQEGIWTVSEWLHLMCSVKPANGSNSVSGGAPAVWSCYKNGQQVGAINGYLPSKDILRPNGWLAASNWPGEFATRHWNGEIDSFYWYNYGLSAEQARVHFIVTRPPIFELGFAEDPRIALGMNEQRAGYGWATQDETDFNGTISNTGVITLNGVNQYLDLGIASGPHSVGTTLPIIGGQTFSGITFEVLFKTPDQQIYARIFDIGAGAPLDNLVLYFRGASYEIWFTVFNSQCVGGRSDFVVITPMILGQWYHVMITIERGANSTQTAYVNGVKTTSITNGCFPRNAARSNAYIGKSWFAGDQYFNGSIDAFRIYDYIVTEEKIAQLYTLVRLPNVFTSAPTCAYSFSRQPLSTQLIGGTNFTWRDQVDGRSGVAAFNGVNQYVNLLTLADDYGRYFPQIIGGALSFEAWVRYDSSNGWSHWIDLGYDNGGDNILIAEDAAGALLVHMYNNRRQSAVVVPNVFSTARWAHIICTFQQRFPSDTVTATAALIQCFINGNLTAGVYGYLPRKVPRSLSWLARSPWTADPYFKGEIDAFYYYDYALSLEQAQVHYLLKRPPMFELGFSEDPRPFVGYSAGAYKYNWIAYETLTFNSTQSNAGIITLNGVDQYINLAQPNGPNSVGTTLDTIGGEGSGTGSEKGWTFEVLFKTPDEQTYARVYDFGAGAGIDNVALWFIGGTRVMQFSTWNSRIGGRNGTVRNPLIVLDPVTLGLWYHVVVTVQPIGTAPYTYSTQTAYVNGVRTRQIVDGYWIDPVARPNSFIGRSGFIDDGNQYFNGSIDALRVYDYVLTPDVITAVYRLTYTEALTSTGANYVPPPPVTRTSSSSAAATSQPITVPSSSSAAAVTPPVTQSSTSSATPQNLAPSSSASEKQSDDRSGNGNGAVIAIVVVVLVLVAAAGGGALYYFRASVFGNGNGNGDGYQGGGSGGRSLWGGDTKKSSLLETEMETSNFSERGNGRYRPPQTSETYEPPRH